MDLYERLSRMMLRRKYNRMEGPSEAVASAPLPPLAKSQSMKAVPRAERPRRLERSGSRSAARVSGSKRFTLRSSSNEVVDGAWFNNALRRSVAEGRINLGSINGSEAPAGNVR